MLSKDKVIWSLKQLLPFKYESYYSTKEGKFFATWRMWMGKPFQINHVKLVE